MKSSLKKAVPIMLAILILVSILWYCFVYDRDFTRDMLLNQARYQSIHGNARLASWFYDLAYRHSNNDEAVAIELANQFKSVGNYTKAEYTLSNAIADGGTVDLYIALCKTYVEQDKLLDAVTMLDNVSDPEIRAQLQTMRPEAPASDPAPGFYNQYISVSLRQTGGTLYYTMDGEFPSIDDVPYSEPITLPAGETTIRAVTVADNGLVSPLATLGFTVGGVIEPVSFDDPAIEAAIREILAVGDETVIYSNQLWTITAFTVPAEAKTLDDLSRLPYLESLSINGQSPDSLRFLSGQNNLKELDLSGCRFPAEELSVLSSLPALQSLNLSDCGLSTVAGLENAQNLTSLNLSNNTVRKLEPLSGLFSLRTLDLSHNALTNLSALSGLTNLQTLDVSYNSLSSIAPIAACGNLEALYVENNALSNLSGADNLSALTVLRASSNNLTDVTVLSACVNLTELSVAKNSLTDISALSTLTRLEVFDFSYNEITALPAWPDGCALRVIDGSYNALESLSNLKNMQNLTHVYMDYNALTSVAALENCSRLVLVNVYGNKIDNVKMLTDQDIIVNYDPTAVE